METNQIDQKEVFKFPIHAYYFGHIDVAVAEAIEVARRIRCVNRSIQTLTYTPPRSKDIIELRPSAHRECVEVDWNGGIFYVTPESTQASALSDWSVAMEKQRKEWQESPERRALLKKFQKEDAERKRVINDNIQSIDQLDFADTDAVMRWFVPTIKAMCYTSTADVQPERNKLIRTFENNGFVCNAHVIP